MAWLSGWKSISAHMGKHPDTLKRWVKKHKLPIYRDPGGRPVAFPEQLDEWKERIIALKNRKRRRL